MTNEGLVLLAAWCGYFALVAALFVTIGRRRPPPGRSGDDRVGPA